MLRMADHLRRGSRDSGRFLTSLRLVTNEPFRQLDRFLDRGAGPGGENGLVTDVVYLGIQIDI